MNKFAATVLSVLLALPGLAQAISLQELVDGASITVGDKLFDNWFADDFSFIPINLDGIDVTGLDDDPLNPGLLYTANGNLIVDSNSNPDGFDLTELDFGFDVTVTDPNFLIKDNSLVFGEASVSTADEDMFAFIDIVEFIFDAAGNLIGDKQVTLDSDGTADLFDDANFAPLTMISIETSILLGADDFGVGEGGASAALETFTQRFSQESVQVPEPASLALIGLGLAGLGFTRRRRARA